MQQRRPAYADLDAEARLALDAEGVRQWRLQTSVDHDAGDEVFQHEIEPDLWSCGHRVLPGMILDGDIAQVLRRLSGYLPRDVAQATTVIAKNFDTAVELATDTMIITLPSVKESILTEWDGYPADGKTGQSTREATVDWIDNKNGVAKVGSSTGPVAVETVHPAARPAYIRTVANGQETDNLLSLARC